jgi:MFS transporter, PAT family, beta-lactamase induction signal transducer AmpG
MGGCVTTRTKLFWVAVLYFAEGFPYGVIKDALPVFFRVHGVGLADIGVLTLVGLPWFLKFLWAPAVDLWGQRRTWILGCQGILVLGILALLIVDPSRVTAVSWALLLSLATLSATQDVAIDAYTIELLDEAEMGPANGLRVTTYRIALISAGGMLVALAGLMGWQAAFLAAALLMGCVVVLSWQMPHPARPRTAAGTRPPGAIAFRDAVWIPLRQFFAHPGFVFVLCFVLLYKLGDMALGPMVRPFWVDRHFSMLQIGTVPGTFGVVSTIGGALVGGVLTKRWGILRALLLLGLAQAASNLTYAAAAALPPSTALMYTASMVESFCGGLGTAPFLAFLMSICDKAHAATQYALLSALFGLTGMITGVASGWAAERLGYATYFTVTFFLAWPALLLLPWVRRWAAARAEALHAPVPNV